MKKNEYVLTQAQHRKPIGGILVDGGFISVQDLNLALMEQTQSSVLLG